MNESLKRYTGELPRFPEKFVENTLSGAVDMLTGADAAEAAREASAASVGAQQEALEYLKEREALPQALRESALAGLGREVGLTLDDQGNVISDGRSMLDIAKASPLYADLLKSGEQSVLRGASATGGLRSGDAISGLEDVGQRALMRSYGDVQQSMRGLAGLPSYAPQIAGGMRGIGETEAMGIMGAEQGKLAAKQNLFDLAMGIGKVFTGGI